MTTMAACFAEARGLIPVITLRDADAALPLAEALGEGGCVVLEITLRTPAGLESIERIRAGFPHLTVGAGTVLTAEQASEAHASGAQFLVSPGLAASVHEHASAAGIPYLPGVGTVTEAMRAQALGYRHLKLFPATSVGGTGMLAAMASVLPDLEFCPTGGVNEANLGDFLSLPNVPVVGGSWLVPEHLVTAGRWKEIREHTLDGMERIAALTG